MNFAGLTYLLIAHYLSGKGVLRLFKPDLKPVPAFCVSMILGVPLLSFAPCILQIPGIPITAAAVFFTTAIMTLIFSIPLLVNFRRPRFNKIVLPRLYEWPFLIACGLLVLVSVWRCFYYPPFSRDMLSGPELIAEFTVKEKTMINSVFTIDLHTTNNYFKSPYITGLQVIYKLLVCPFGQLWLSVLFVPFIVWLYSVLRERLHPLVAGMLLLFFITTPDLYAYTYVILYDYSNMIFFFSGFYFLARCMENNKVNEFIFSAFLFGIATYIRTETVLLVTMIVPMLTVYFFRTRLPFKKAVARVFVFLIIPAAFYFLCINVFIPLFIPIPFDVNSEINPGKISAFFTRLSDMNSILIFSRAGKEIYGYFIFLFCGVLLTDLLWLRRFNKQSLVALYGIGVVYTGLALLGYLLPLVDLENTTKRGLFKALPLMLFYMGNSGILFRLSDLIKKWEYANEADQNPNCKIKSPDIKLQKPDSEIQSPDARFPNPDQHL